MNTIIIPFCFKADVFHGRIIIFLETQKILNILWHYQFCESFFLYNSFSVDILKINNPFLPFDLFIFLLQLKSVIRN